MRSHVKFGPDQFSRFDVYWIQTDRQTNKAYIEICIEFIYVDINKVKYRGIPYPTIMSTVNHGKNMRKH